MEKSKRNPLGWLALALSILAAPIGIIIGACTRGEAIMEAAVTAIVLLVPAFILALATIKTTLGKVAAVISLIMGMLTVLVFMG